MNTKTKTMIERPDHQTSNPLRSKPMMESEESPIIYTCSTRLIMIDLKPLKLPYH